MTKRKPRPKRPARFTITASATPLIPAAASNVVYTQVTYNDGVFIYVKAK